MAENFGGVCWIVPVKRGSSAVIAASSGRVRGGDDLALGVVGVGLRAPGDGELIGLAPSMTKGTVLVASPSAIGSRPEASGSSVPAWPAFSDTEITVFSSGSIATSPRCST
jgi:hypothetical protein